ncbi:recombinase family protein [Amycolatopsis sp. NPDC101161]|uniref:recombinase family protein n=1 Tax=Amycolatopsis sp. NPDC101161 TaxID=3363940 RepID=UPI00382CBBB0
MTALLDEEPRLATLGPLAYGYMRVPADVPDKKVHRLERQLREFATRHGLYFVSFFFEFSCGSREGFDELVTELKRADARHVVVPSLRHLAHSRLLQLALCEQLQREAQADVLAMAYRTEIE